MSAFLLAAALSLPVRADGLGGHAAPAAAASPAADDADARRATLAEMWRRRILPPDQEQWSPSDMQLLARIRRDEPDALAYLGRKFGGVRPWVSRAKGAAPRLLTKEGDERYRFLITQDAIAYFESKGAEARDVFALKGWDGAALFDSAGGLTDDGIRLYERARLKLPAFWRGPGGEVYGTRRPPP